MNILLALVLLLLQSADDITLTEVNTFLLPHVCLGLDVFDYPGAVGLTIVDSESDKIQAYSASTGGKYATIDLDPANENAFGATWTSPASLQCFLVNDVLVPDLFVTNNAGASWFTISNPAGSEGRGMDFDGAEIWCAGETNTLWQFDPEGTPYSHTLPEITEQISGLAVFPYEDDLGIVIACYLSPELYFYRYNGTEITYWGSAALPMSVKYSLGLAYSSYSGHFYWSFLHENTTSGYSVLDITVNSLARDTWAGIKYSF